VKNHKNIVAIRMKPHAWLDEGIDQCLGGQQQKGNINTTWANNILLRRARRLQIPC
jgi:hypothetical protein